MLRGLGIAHEKVQCHSELRSSTGDELDVRMGLVDVERFLEDGGGFRALTGLPVSTPKRTQDVRALEPGLFSFQEGCEDPDGFRGLALGCELVSACHCHCSFTSLFFESSVRHEVRDRLPELCRQVLEGFHRGPDLSELDGAHVGTRVVGSAELRLAQSGRRACLTKA